MDGNRRWARERGLDPVEGHDYAAMHAIEPIIERCSDLKIPYVTFWAFSTENWKRDKEEIKGLMNVFRKGLRVLAMRFIKKGARFRILGDVSKFPKDIAEKSIELMNLSRTNKVITVNFALNYGGRDEILRAVKKTVALGLKPQEITEDLFNSQLDTAGIPDVDLIIRTGGEQRLSGFLPWQSIYAELYFAKDLFPDFSVDKFNIALEEYSNRDRRFGADSVKTPSAPQK